MLLLFWVLLFAVGACLLLMMPALWGKHIFDQYRQPRPVTCPETRSQVSVRFNAFRAAATGLSGPPSLRLIECTRWPERAGCDQDCIPEAQRNTPVKEAGVVPSSRKAFPHLPVLVATGAAWVLGMVWHSEYLFRARWSSALNLSDRQTRDLAEMWSPHLLTAAACLLFAYCVAWITVWLGKRSLFMGIRVAASVWVLTAAGVMIAGGGSLPSDLLKIEGGFSLLGALLVGALVGGLPRWIFVNEPE